VGPRTALEVGSGFGCGLLGIAPVRAKRHVPGIAEEAKPLGQPAEEFGQQFDALAPEELRRLDRPRDS